MRRRTLALTWKLACLAALCMLQVRANVASAADSSEIWPQVSAFVGLGPRTRLYLDAAYAEGKESDTQSLERPLSCVCANDCSWPNREVDERLLTKASQRLFRQISPAWAKGRLGEIAGETSPRPSSRCRT